MITLRYAVREEVIKILDILEWTNISDIRIYKNGDYWDIEIFEAIPLQNNDI